VQRDAQAALNGLVVIDLSHVLAGPYCTMLLGDLGAPVIKIERPGCGDDTRQFGPPFLGGESVYYLGFNRNKWSVALDFSTQEGKQQMLDLLQGADIVIENFRPGSLERKGLDYNSLKALNPGLIYCSIHGYSEKGSSAARPGYDLVAQAESGLMSIIGDPDGPPLPVGVPIIDIATGMLACTAILAALHVRESTGKGQHITISLLETAVSLLSDVASSYLATGQEPQRYGNGHPMLVPYQEFDTQNKRIVICAGNDRLYAKLCHVLGLAELVTDPRFCTNALRVQHRAELLPILQATLLEREACDWLDELQHCGIPCGLVRTVGEMFQDPDVRASGIIWECHHPTAGKIHMVGSPLHMSGTPPRLYKAPPLLGEDTSLLHDTCDRKKNNGLLPQVSDHCEPVVRKIHQFLMEM
jgi:crotonobetainyl-CoA:carnitine CoA-transferase CaiB-like acyl-CoA transferase